MITRDWQPPALPTVLLRSLPGLSLKVEGNVSLEVEGLGIKLLVPGLDLTCLSPDAAGGALTPGLKVSLAIHPLSLTLLQQSRDQKKSGPGAADMPAHHDTQPSAQLISCHGMHAEVVINSER